MFRVQEVEATLRRAMIDGVTNVMLVTDDGSLVAAACTEEVDHTVSAVLASIFNEYKGVEKHVDPGNPSSLQLMLFDCATARVACTGFVPDVEDSPILLCVCGDRRTHYGILCSKLDYLKSSLECLGPVFAPMAGIGG
uniref:Roadblock/LAMTOR2 domain-containing protein n=1 Tax=Alexandrium monilatum TaxID=311494 RepID=A0A7S4PU28_9DINO